MLKAEIDQLKSEIAAAQEAIIFIESPAIYEPDAAQNSILHDLRALITSEQSESDRVTRLKQAKQLLKGKQALLEQKQAQFDECDQAAAIARQNLETAAAKLQTLIEQFSTEFNSTMLEMRSIVDDNRQSLAELGYEGLRLKFQPGDPFEAIGTLPTVKVSDNAITIANHWYRPTSVHPLQFIDCLGDSLPKFWAGLEAECDRQVTA